MKGFLNKCKKSIFRYLDIFACKGKGNKGKGSCLASYLDIPKLHEISHAPEPIHFPSLSGSQYSLQL